MSTTPPDTDTKRSKQIEQAQACMYERDFNGALSLIDGLLANSPDDADALYMQAVCYRYSRQFDAAHDAINRLKTLSPEFGRAYQEEGHLHRDRGDTNRALAAYRHACQCNPALEAAWKGQADILAAQGAETEAAQAYSQIERLKQLPRELLAVTNYIHEGKTLKAEELCRYFLQQQPHHIEAMRLLADIGVRLGVLDQADFLLESAIELDPNNVQLRLDHIQVLRKRQKFDAALKQARYLYDQTPDNPLFQSHYAIEAMQTGDYDTAFTLFDDILAKLPDDAATLTTRGHALKTCGRQDEAIASYRAAFTAKPGHGDAYYALANLKTYRFDEAELEQMRRQEQRPDLTHMDRVHLCFALAKALEDRGDYDESFHYYERGNTLKRTQSRYDADQMANELKAQADICTAELFENQGGKGHPAPDPIFIVGLPRAGSTLIEQILASHSQIDGTMELPNILSLAHRLRGRSGGSESVRYPGVLHELPGEDLHRMGESFIEETRIHRADAPFFIDKMPNNFRHLALIHLIFPNAKIIDARRAPLDCCFSCFKQLFAEGQEFTYGLEEIGRYYGNYVDLMAHWDDVLPGRILRVQHEEVLDDLEGQVRRMLDYLELPFEATCLDFHKTERAVRTASSEQVRRPINRDGVGSWAPYEPWLEPLTEALNRYTAGPLS